MRTIWLCIVAALIRGVIAAEPEASTNRVQKIDLPTTLRLAGARNLDVQIARERLAEARANLDASVWQFFPWISAGAGYRRHDNLIQDVGGAVFNADKESYSIGPTISGQIDLGDAIYKNLAARQLARAAEFAVESQRQDSLLQASDAYFELLKAQSAVRVATEAVRIATNYLQQIQRGVEAGIAFRGEALRVQVQAERNENTLRQAEQQVHVASAKLVQALHLSPTELSANDQELIPMSLVATNVALDALVSQALVARPELKQNRATIEAARKAKEGAVYGAAIPSIGGQVFAGGFGGGKDGGAHTFGGSEDYQVSLGWRIGPGGLFDRPRIRANEARLRIANLSAEKLQDEITRDVVENHSRLQSLAAQLATSQRAVKAAEDVLRLSIERQQFAVANVLETILAEQELTRARLDLANVISDYDKTQYALLRAVGGRLAAE